MKRVLVVDDTRNIRTLLTTFLEVNGYSVTSAKNGLEAYELVTKESFDLAFLDIKIPELSGTEILRRIRSLGHTYPVVVMTAYATVKNAVECTKLGAVAYLQKPFKIDKIYEVLNTLESYNEDSTLRKDISKAAGLIESHNDDEALKLLKKCLSIDPSIGEIYYMLGKISERNNELQKSQRYYGAAEIFGYLI